MPILSRVNSWLAQMEHLAELVERHRLDRGYRAEDTGMKDGYRSFSIDVPGKDAAVRLAFNGEVFLLSFPGGYSWAEFAYRDEDRDEALSDLLRFLDAYADPGTQEVTVRRRLRPHRRELHVSNGAVLRARGWCKGPLAR